MLNYESDQASGIVDGANQKVLDDLNARCSGSGCPVQFAVMTDGSGVKFNRGFGGAAACPQPGSSPTANENCIIAHGWHIYANGTDEFGAGQTSSISAPMSLAAGTYTIIVRAWNSTGAFGDQTFTMTVQ